MGKKSRSAAAEVRTIEVSIPFGNELSAMNSYDVRVSPAGHGVELWTSFWTGIDTSGGTAQLYNVLPFGVIQIAQSFREGSFLDTASTFLDGPAKASGTLARLEKASPNATVHVRHINHIKAIIGPMGGQLQLGLINPAQVLAGPRKVTGIPVMQLISPASVMAGLIHELLDACDQYLETHPEVARTMASTAIRSHSEESDA